MTAEQKQLSLEYQENGWPKQHAHEISPHTPEEVLLKDAVNILDDLLQGEAGRYIQSMTRMALDRVKSLIDPVLDVVSDYSHMKAKLSELEAEVDSRDERIAELEEKLERAGDPDEDDPDDPESIPF